MASALSTKTIIPIYSEYKSQQTHDMVGGLKSDTPPPSLCPSICCQISDSPVVVVAQ